MFWLDNAVRMVIIILFLWYEYHNALLQSTIHGIFTSVFYI